MKAFKVKIFVFPTLQPSKIWREIPKKMAVIYHQDQPPFGRMLREGERGTKTRIESGD